MFKDSLDSEFLRNFCGSQRIKEWKREEFGMIGESWVAQIRDLEERNHIEEIECWISWKNMHGGKF